MHLDRPQVGEQPEIAAQGEQRLFRPHRRRWVGPLRPADSAEQDRIGRPACLDVLGSDRDAIRIDRGAPGDDLRPLDGEVEPLAGGVEHTPGGIDHVGPDAIAGDRNDPVAHQGSPRSVRWFAKATATPLISAPWSLFVATR